MYELLVSTYSGAFYWSNEVDGFSECLVKLVRLVL